MNKPEKVYSSLIHRGPKMPVTVDGKEQFFQKPVGAVVGVIQGDTLKIGWSLCNTKTKIQRRAGNTLKVIVGDRFNHELATSLAGGRARDQHTHSLKFSRTKGPTTEQLITGGVPQSSIKYIKELVEIVFHRHKEVKSVVIFSSKAPVTVARQPEYVW